MIDDTFFLLIERAISCMSRSNTSRRSPRTLFSLDSTKFVHNFEDVSEGACWIGSVLMDFIMGEVNLAPTRKTNEQHSETQNGQQFGFTNFEYLLTGKLESNLMLKF